MDWLKKLFTSSKTTDKSQEVKSESARPKPATKQDPTPKPMPEETPKASSNPEPESDSIIDIDHPSYELSFAARDRYWNNIGKLDDDVIAHIISPQFQGAPAWPTTRQSYKIVRTDTSVILASDGLSDPFVDTDMKQNGFESEVFIETSDLLGANFDELVKSWQYEAVELWARNIANYGGINSNLEKYPVMSIELPVQKAPEDWKNEDGNVGFLVNAQGTGRDYEVSDMPLSPTKIISLTAIKPEELKFVIEGGQEARDALVTALETSGFTHLSNANRPNVLK